MKTPVVKLTKVPAGLKNRTKLLQELAQKHHFSRVSVGRLDMNSRSDVYTVVAFSDHPERIILGTNLFSIAKKKATPAALFEKVQEAFTKASEIINNKISKL